MSVTNETLLTVRYCETDQMAIVHHSIYFQWFEVGRTEFIAKSNISYSSMEDKGVLMPLTDASAKYIKGAKYEDRLLIRTRLERLTPVRCEFYYEVVRENDNILIANGKTAHAFVDKNFKPMNLRKKNPEIWSVLEALL